jgi:hypothetical protein
MNLKNQIRTLKGSMNPFVYHKREELVVRLLWQHLDGRLGLQDPLARRRHLHELIDKAIEREFPSYMPHVQAKKVAENAQAQPRSSVLSADED